MSKTVGIPQDFTASHVFAMAVLRINHPEMEIIRDPDLYSVCDFLIGVGGDFNRPQGRFDHHAAHIIRRQNRSVPFGPFGLVWSGFGWIELKTGVVLWRQIDDLLAEPIDRDGFSGFDLHTGMTDTELMECVIRAQEMIEDLMEGLLKMSQAPNTTHSA